jgi:DNA-binding MarR family transcriptional regulator
MISLLARVHSNYLDLIGEELDRIGSDDINSIQARILFNIGDAKIPINEVKTRGNYLGSNVSYIIRKLFESGYLFRERSLYDLRAVDIWLSGKGRALCDRLTEMHDGRIGMSPDPGGNPDLERTVWTLRQIEQFWIDRLLDP